MSPATAQLPSSRRVEPLALLVADDLTGACDAGVAFARRGLVTRVGLHAAPCAEADVLALNTSSRHMTASAAARHLADLCGALPTPQKIAFRKIDSTLRGNIVSECDALLTTLGLGFGVVAPSLPSQGRTLREGILHIRDIAGERCLDAMDWLRRQRGAAVSLPAFTSEEQAREEIEAAAEAGARYVLCDAATDADLRVIARALHGCAARPLWIGSAGLAAQAAELLAADGQWRDNENRWASSGAAALLCCGSDHAVTRMQLAHLRESLGAPILESVAAEADDIRSALARSGAVILQIDLSNIESARLRSQLEAALASGVGRVLLTGGETAQAVCGAAGVDHLLLTGEGVPGIPEGLIQGGLLDGIMVATKSGGFGQEDCLTAMLAAAVSSGGNDTRRELR